MRNEVFQQKIGHHKRNKTLAPKIRQHDEFLAVLNWIFTFARWFGIPCYGGIIALCWAIIMLLMLTALEVAAIRKVIWALSGWSALVSNGRGVASRLSGAIFYGNALISLILSWRVISSWKDLSLYWARTETTAGLYFPPDVTIKRRVIIVTVFVATCAFVEHTMSMISATGFECPPSEYFRRYILSSHGFLLRPHEYNLWLAIPIFILSKLATILWNFQDLIIILISMGLTSRYHRLNLFVNRVVKFERHAGDVEKLGSEIYAQILTWRKLREAYVRQSALVHKIDGKLGALVLLSNFNNFYFICLQLFLGINKEESSLINRIYFFVSLGWLIFRACSVVLAAAGVNLHSRRALYSLYSCPGSAYNVEIKRLVYQMNYDCVALRGMRLFSLDRQMLLQVAAAIIKYELVLVQFDN